MKERKGLLPDEVTFNLIIGIAITIVLLSVIIPLILSQQGNTGCVGVVKWVGSVIADSTGFSMC